MSSPVSIGLNSPYTLYQRQKQPTRVQSSVFAGADNQGLPAGQGPQQDSYGPMNATNPAGNNMDLQALAQAMGQQQAGAQPASIGMPPGGTMSPPNPASNNMDIQALSQALAQQQQAAEAPSDMSPGGGSTNLQALPGQAAQQQSLPGGTVYQHPSGGFAEKSTHSSEGGFWSSGKGITTIVAGIGLAGLAYWNRAALFGLFKSSANKAPALLKNLHTTEKELMEALNKEKPEIDVIDTFGARIDDFIGKTKKHLGNNAAQHEKPLNALTTEFNALKDALGKNESITSHKKNLKGAFNTVYTDVIKKSDIFKEGVKNHLQSTHDNVTTAIESLKAKVDTEHPPIGDEAVQEIKDAFKVHKQAADRLLENHGISEIHADDLIKKAANGPVNEREAALNELKHQLERAQKSDFGFSEIQQTFKQASLQKAQTAAEAKVKAAEAAEAKKTHAKLAETTKDIHPEVLKVDQAFIEQAENVAGQPEEVKKLQEALQQKMITLDGEITNLAKSPDKKTYHEALTLQTHYEAHQKLLSSKTLKENLAVFKTRVAEDQRKLDAALTAKMELETKTQAADEAKTAQQAAETAHTEAQKKLAEESKFPKLNVDD